MLICVGNGLFMFWWVILLYDLFLIRFLFLFIPFSLCLLMILLSSLWTKVFLWLLSFILLLFFWIFQIYLFSFFLLIFLLVTTNRSLYTFLGNICILIDFEFRFCIYFDGFLIDRNNLSHLLCDLLFLGWT